MPDLMLPTSQPERILRESTLVCFPYRVLCSYKGDVMSQITNTDRHFDAIILGCGSAGTTAAKRLRASGRSVAVIERDQPGGDCPLRACVPTKALLRSAHVYALLKRAGEFGIEVGAVAFDWARVMARKDEVVGRTGA